jgi:hypothetical protein
MITTKQLQLLALLLMLLPVTINAQFGSGSFGPYSAFGPGEVINQYTAVVDVNSSTREIETSNASLFFPSSKALLIQMEGGVPGTWEFVHVVQTTANMVRVLSIQRTYDPFAGRVQLVTVPEYSSLFIPSGTSVVPLPWNGFTGGVVTCMVSGALTIDAGGFIDASGAGFQSGSQGFGGVGGQGGAGGIAPGGNGGAFGPLGNAFSGGGYGAEYGLPANLPTSPSQPNCPGCAAGSTNAGNISANLLVMGGCGYGGSGGNGSDGAGGGGAGAHGTVLGLDGTPGGSGGTGGDGGIGGAGGGVILISARTLDLPQQECMLANGTSALSGGLAGNGGSGGDGGLGGDGCNTGGSGGGGGGADGANGGDGGNGGSGGMIKIIRGTASPAPQSFHRVVNGGFGAIGGFGGIGGAGGSNGPLRGLLCGGGAGTPTPLIGGGCHAGEVLTFLQSIGAAGNNSGVYTSLGSGLHQYVSGADTVFIRELASQEVFVRARFGIFDYYTLIVGSSTLPSPWGIVHEIFTQGNVLFFNTIVTTLTNANGTYDSECPIFFANTPPNGNNGSNGANGIDGGPGSVGDETASDCNDDPIYVMVTPVVPYTCPESPGVIEASVISGGTAPYTYTYSSFSSFQQNTTGSFSVGNEMGEIIAVDANGCISDPVIAMPDVLITEDWNVSTLLPACIGAANGAATLAVDSLYGSLPLQLVGDLLGITNLNTGDTYYPVYTSAYSAVFTGLPAGVYYILQTQCNDDPVISFEISESSSLSASATVTDALCAPNGSILLDVMGGTAPIAILWSDGQTSNPAVGLSAQSLSVTITDAQGCSYTDSYTVGGSSSALLATFQNQPEVCAQLNGFSEVLVSGGSAPYSYAWSNGGTTQIIEYVAAGNYSVVVTDALGCSATFNTSVQASGVYPILSANIRNVSCYGLANGDLEILVSSGLAPYTYAWSNGESTAAIQQLTPGTYSVVVTGDDGCSSTAQYQITHPDSIALSAIVTQQDCSGNAGSIDITVGGGAGGFAYSWSNGSNAQDVFGLSEGTYSVQVVDSNACVRSESFVIDSLQLPIISGITFPDSCGNASGSIDITVSRVNAPFTYSWSTGSTSEDLTNLTPGLYVVTVTDASQCQSTATFTVGGSIEPVITIGFAVTSDCGAGGSVYVLAGSASPIATYQWSDGSSSPQLTGVSGGIYSLVVTDVNGCRASGRVVVPQSRPLELSAQATAAFCSPANSGSIDLSVISGTPRYTFLWSNGATSEDINQVTAGTYTVVVTDANGCTTEGSYTVGDGCLCPVNFNAEICGPTVICQGESLTLNSVVTPRTQGFPVTYSWTRSPATFTANTASITQTGLTAGTYTYVLVVTYSPVCSVTVQHTVTVRPRPVIAVTNQLTGNNTVATQLAGCDIILNATGGVYYNWSYNGVTFPSHTSPLTDSNTGITTSTQLRTYGVVGIDQYGCSNTASIQVRLTRLTVTGTYSTAPAGPNVTVSGNVPTAFTNATYAWTGPGGFFTTPSTVVRNFSRINLLPALLGTYSVSVTQNGCTKTASFQLSGDGVITLLPAAPTGTAISVMLPENEVIHSDERFADATQEQALKFEVFPNPTTDQLRITGETAYPVYAIVRIYDFAGQLVFDSTQGEKQFFNEELNVSSLAPGNYIVVMDCGSGGMWSGRFTKM